MSLFTTYAATIRFRSRVMGGVPKDPKIIEPWLRKKAGVDDAIEVKQMLVRTLSDLGLDVTPDMDFAALEEASASLANKGAVGFKTNGQGPCLESRCIKAALKEVTHILYAGEKWGTTKKGPKSYVAERVFVDPDLVWLGVPEPSGVDLFVGHVTDRNGPRSTLTYYEYVEQPTVTFQVKVLRDCITAEQWAEIWEAAGENGIGALRSQGFGRFDVQWAPAPAASNGLVRDMVAV